MSLSELGITSVYEPEPESADWWGRKAETVLWEIRQMSAALFTAGELFYVQHWTVKMRWGTTPAFEKKRFEEWSQLKTDLESRAARLGNPLALIDELETVKAERDEKGRMIDTMYLILKEQPPEIRDVVWAAMKEKAKD